MADVTGVKFEENGEPFEIYIETKLSGLGKDDDLGGMGFGLSNRVEKMSYENMQQAQNMIRGYTLFALNAFKNMGDANVEEVSLKFGLRISGKAGIPYITEGSADCNLEVSVKCKFPGKDT